MRGRLGLLLVVAIMALRCGGQSPTAPTATTPATGRPPETSPPSPVAPTSGTPQIFVGAGDISMCDSNAESTARLLDGIGGTVFTLGDHAYFHGTREEFRTCYDPTWGRHKARTRPVPGNHDYESAGAAPYFEYFGPNAGTAGAGYYSFDVGAWHVVALNSNISIDSQLAWLQRDLLANRAECTLAYFHHPLFTSGPDGSTPDVYPLWQVLYDAGAEVVLNGHEHFYERFAPQDPGGRADPVRGLREFIVGTGGAALYQPVRLAPNSETRISSFGVLKLTLAAGRYDWEFVPVGGASDRGTGACH